MYGYVFINKMNINSKQTYIMYTQTIILDAINQH